MNCFSVASLLLLFSFQTFALRFQRHLRSLNLNDPSSFDNEDLLLSDAGNSTDPMPATTTTEASNGLTQNEIIWISIGGGFGAVLCLIIICL